MPSANRIALALQFTDPETYRKVVLGIAVSDLQTATAKVQTLESMLADARERLAVAAGTVQEMEDQFATGRPYPTAVPKVIGDDFLPAISKASANGHAFTDRETNFGCH